jgi:glycosyltransferase involved in cell wall biosynthesis
MKKILYVVHRYAPYPGGSENHIRDLAEETVAQGNDVTVFTGLHNGNLNSVKVTSDVSILKESFDLIVVHGGDVAIQNFVLSNAKNIKSPILYLIILPSDSDVCIKALHDVKYIGCCTEADWKHVEKYNVYNKAKHIPISINPKISVGVSGFKKKYGINTPKMFLSSGGFWPHKGMEELCELYLRVPIKDTTLVLTGYQNSDLMPKNTNKIRSILLEDRQEVLNAIFEADLYIMNSTHEGFGLVLLEAVLNKTPWISREIAGAKEMKNYGQTYTTRQELMKLIYHFDRDEDKVEKAKQFVLNYYTTSFAVEKILELIC